MNGVVAHDKRGTKIVAIALAVSAIAALVWRFPLVRIVRTDGGERATVSGAFDAERYALELWNDQLGALENQAHDAGDVLAALRRSPSEACRRFGRAGSGARSCLYLLRGAGKVISVEKNAVSVSLGDEAVADLSIVSGLIFGNVVRDAGGWVDPNSFSSLQDYNAVSEALNQLVETRVLPTLSQGAVVGQRIDFVGAVEVKRVWKTTQPLTVVPLRVTMK